MGEYVGDKLNRKRPSKNLHKTRALIKDCDDRNNWRNNDVLGVAQANGMLKGEKAINPLTNRSTNLNETEDTLIDFLDAIETKALKRT